MKKAILIRGARQLLTLNGPNSPRRGADLRNLGLIQDGAVLIQDGLIRAVGPSRRVENLAEASGAEEIDAHGRVVMPGFVDSHTHLISGPARVADQEMRVAGAGPDQIAAAGGGLAGIVKMIQEVPGRTLEIHAWRVIQECIRQGTTTLEAKSGYGVTDTGELKILRAQLALNNRLPILVSTFMGARCLPEGFSMDQREYADYLCEHLLPLVRRRKLAEFVDVFCEGCMLSVDLARQVLQTAKDLGFALKVHAGQYNDLGGIRLAVEMGAVSVDHALHHNDGDLDALAGSGTIATLLPGSIFYLGGRQYPSGRAMIDRGIAVAMATNFNPETSPTHNMQMILCLACQRMGMTPAEAISAATINGACALRRGDQVGSLEKGKWADLIMLSVGDYRELAYHFGVNLVEMTMKRGAVVHQASEVMCPSA